MKEYHFIKLTKSFQRFLSNLPECDVNIDLVYEKGVGTFLCEKGEEKIEFQLKDKKHDLSKLLLTEFDFKDTSTIKDFTSFQSVLSLQGNDGIYKITEDEIRTNEILRNERKASLRKRSTEVDSVKKSSTKGKSVPRVKRPKATSIEKVSLSPVCKRSRASHETISSKYSSIVYNELVRKYRSLQLKYKDRSERRRQLDTEFKYAMMIKDKVEIEKCLVNLEQLFNSFTEEELVEYCGIVELHKSLAKMKKSIMK